MRSLSKNSASSSIKTTPASNTNSQKKFINLVTSSDDSSPPVGTSIPHTTTGASPSIRTSSKYKYGPTKDDKVKSDYEQLKWASQLSSPKSAKGCSSSTERTTPKSSTPSSTTAANSKVFEFDQLKSSIIRDLHYSTLLRNKLDLTDKRNSSSDRKTSADKRQSAERKSTTTEPEEKKTQISKISRIILSTYFFL